MTADLGACPAGSGSVIFRRFDGGVPVRLADGFTKWRLRLLQDPGAGLRSDQEDDLDE